MNLHSASLEPENQAPVKTPDVAKWPHSNPEKTKLDKEPELQDFLEDLKTYRRYKHWLSAIRYVFWSVLAVVLLALWQLWNFSFGEITRLTDRISSLETTQKVSTEKNVDARLQEIEKYKSLDIYMTDQLKKEIDSIAPCTRSASILSKKSSCK